MHSIAEKMRLLEPTTEIWMKIDTYYRRQKCRPIIVVSGGIRFMRIFAEVPWRRGRQTTVGFSRTAIFSVFAGYFSDTLEMRPALLYGNMHAVRRRLFSYPKMRDIEWPWRAISRYIISRRFGWLRLCEFEKIVAWKLIKMDRYCQRWKSLAGTVVSDDIRLVWIFAQFL